MKRSLLVQRVLSFMQGYSIRRGHSASELKNPIL